MNLHKKEVTALGLCSGGLDSILSALVLREQGITVEWITFETPFFSSDKARKASSDTDIPLTVKNITQVYLEMLKKPRCGYGQHMNPCMDCHALMFRLSGEIMKENGYDFLFSGEVLGQRPMSQTKSSLRYVEKHSGFDGHIVRPLSAKRLPETIPEKEGLVDRERLLDLSGRSRKPQMALAEQFGITDYPTPAGGCLLTDKGYSARLRDLFSHQETCTENELHLLKYGRQFRMDDHTKAIVGRTRHDNENILRHHDPGADTLIRMEGFPGPDVLIPNGGTRDMTMLAASICAAYSKAPDNIYADAMIVTPEGDEIVRVEGMNRDQFRHFLII
ncbi:tRNA 4-thiouridine(8) synthase ThiI [Desulfococcaceae bacterium HSG8]|nr:tRNA 4-thiouridine(8) synthase ThiI [Desulfococcaceae bacterium HSG8]